MSDVSKIRESIKEALLEQEMRAQIYELVQAQPGMNKNQLTDEVGAPSAHVSYHLDRLVINGLLEEVPGMQGREVLLFLPSQEALWQDEQTRILFGRAPLRKVALFVAEHPGTTSREIAKALDRTPATIRYHLRALRERNLVESARSGSKPTYHPTRALKSWVDEVGHAYERPWDSDDDEA